MAIPDFQSIMLPLLKFGSDNQEHSNSESTKFLTDLFKLTEEEQKEMLPSKKQPLFYNRVAWAKAYLKMAGLIENTKRGHFKITPKGADILSQNPQIINLKFIKELPEYRAFVDNWRSNKTDKESTIESDAVETQTPEEVLDASYEKIQEALAQDLLSKVKSCPPAFFEILVVELLVKMGYGGSLNDAGSVVGKSGDEGIDGIIKEDKLGLDIIYIQAKRWEGSVGRPEIQKFVGALAGQGAKKGMFITTSRFTPDAKSYTPRNETKIVLIDGEHLAQLMIEYNLGVTTQTTYEIKRIDSDYFEQD